MFKDYGITQGTMSLFMDNQSAINISKNLVQHSITKYIDIQHHFIRELVEKKNVVLSYIKTEHWLTDILTKPFDSHRFKYIRNAIGLCTL